MIVVACACAWREGSTISDDRASNVAGSVGRRERIEVSTGRDFKGAEPVTLRAVWVAVRPSWTHLRRGLPAYRWLAKMILEWVAKFVNGFFGEGSGKPE